MTRSVLIAIAALCLPTNAHATWSIVAVDPDTGEVGVAGATCGPMVWMIGDTAPGRGAVAAQYATKLSLKRHALDELDAGATPQEALDFITDAEQDDDVAVRQYGLAGLAGPAVAFTGSDVEDWSGSLSSETVTVQGNTLRGEAVVQAAFDAYMAAEGEILEERLLQALEAGAAEGGDKRCDFDVAAKSAFLFVAEPDDHRPTLDLTASDKDGAVAALREKYDGGKSHNWHCSATGGAAPTGVLVLLGLVGLARRRTGFTRSPQ